MLYIIFFLVFLSIFSQIRLFIASITSKYIAYFEYLFIFCILVAPNKISGIMFIANAWCNGIYNNKR